MSTKPKYTVEPGRSIARDGVEILHIGRPTNPRGFGCTPREADEYTRRIVHALNVMPELLAALRAVVAMTDGSQPIDAPGARMVAQYALTLAEESCKP